MRRLRRFGLAAFRPATVLVGAALVLAGCGSLTSYAAKVNGQRVTQNELDRELNAILGNKAYLERVDQGFAEQTGERAVGPGEGTFNTVFVARVLERRIAFELVRQEFNRRKLRVTDKDLEDARKELLDSLQDPKVLDAFPRSYREELIRSTAQAAVLERALTQAPSDDAAVRDYYDKNRARFQTSCASHILVPDRDQAARIKSRLDRGEDFAAVARAESKDTQTAPRGGDLGCFPRGATVAAFDAAVERLQPNQVSDPVQTQLGFHVIKLRERRDPTLEQAAPDIRQRLQQEAPNAFRNFMAEAFSKAKITVNPRYGRFVQTGDQVGIQAPSELTTTTSPSGSAPQP